jgi:hypothetical protein
MKNDDIDVKTRPIIHIRRFCATRERYLVAPTRALTKEISRMSDIRVPVVRVGCVRAVQGVRRCGNSRNMRMVAIM